MFNRVDNTFYVSVIGDIIKHPVVTIYEFCSEFIEFNLVISFKNFTNIVELSEGFYKAFEGLTVPHVFTFKSNDVDYFSLFHNCCIIFN